MDVKGRAECRACLAHSLSVATRAISDYVKESVCVGTSSGVVVIIWLSRRKWH
jgi:hypothetical protein